MKIRIMEALDIDLEKEMWCCNRCGTELTGAGDNYKKGCLVRERLPSEVHEPLVEDSSFSFAPDPDWCRLIEFYCPRCGVMIENQYLPPGHPITHDIELDIEALKQRYGADSQAGSLSRK
ncbi:MAG: acetophenone carboxylase [Syntrophorhabdus aromaticivorans]|uniref:Acetophenone carboxylase n=1 Tax=Syntrophorhabdus aromaticivorans TaxID=328301 RepID=A0A351TZ65_9BACT|nr:acetophenone carboxylase [Syntrophorhabdus aromaticivorans]HBA52996.1 acetophenone carboxylase [Syntrophorhabdus aromaticivorans]